MTLKQYLLDGKASAKPETKSYSYEELKIFSVITIHDQKLLLTYENMAWLATKILNLWNIAFQVYEEKLYDSFIEDNYELRIQNDIEAGYSQNYADRICDLIIDTFITEE